MDKPLVYAQLANLQGFRERLADRRSEEFLDSYTNYLLSRDWAYMKNEIDKSLRDISEVRPEGSFAEFMQGRDKSKVIIFGAGQDGRKTKLLLEKMKMSPAFFTDNDKKLWGNKIDGTEVIPPKELIYQYRDYVVLIGSAKYGDIFFKQLLSYWFPQKNIFYSPYGVLRADLGWQYFDLPYFSHDAQEVFVDCGCHIGESSHDFIKWCNGVYKKIYAFEPDRQGFACCRQNMQNIKSLQLIPKGVYSGTATLKFHENGGASRIEENGSVSVEVISVDQALGGDRATFIKMDIEGAELSALRGAEKTIQVHYPKLAICIYHKLTDLIEIAEYLMRTAPEYRYAIRMYATSFSETVLYAWKE